MITLEKRCEFCDKEDSDVKELPYKLWDARFGSRSIKKVWAHKECSLKDFNERVISLAEFDEVMDYCEYFVRDGIKDGNRNGKYVREGKEHPVKGYWNGHEIWGGYFFPHLDQDEPYASEATNLFRKYKNLNAKKGQGVKHIDKSKEDREREIFLIEKNRESEKRNRDMMASFQKFLVDNGWNKKNWFRLNSRYI